MRNVTPDNSESFLFETPYCLPNVETSFLLALLQSYPTNSRVSPLVFIKSHLSLFPRSNVVMKSDFFMGSIAHFGNINGITKLQTIWPNVICTPSPRKIPNTDVTPILIGNALKTPKPVRSTIY